MIDMREQTRRAAAAASGAAVRAAELAEAAAGAERDRLQRQQAAEAAAAAWERQRRQMAADARSTVNALTAKVRALLAEPVDDVRPDPATRSSARVLLRVPAPDAELVDRLYRADGRLGTLLQAQNEIQRTLSHFVAIGVEDEEVYATLDALEVGAHRAVLARARELAGES